MDLKEFTIERIASEVNINIENKKYLLTKFLLLREELKKSGDPCLINNTVVSFLEHFFYQSSKLQEIKSNFFVCRSYPNAENIIFPKTKKYRNKKIIEEKSRFDQSIRVLRKYQNEELIPEFLKGYFFVNRLRREIPNFAYTYNLIEVNDPAFSSVSGIEMPKKFPYKFIIEEELIEPVTSWEELIVRSDISSLYFLIFQVALSLCIAKKEIDFAHHDLHDNNVVIRFKPFSCSSQNLEYEYNGHKYSLSTSLVATIIDYEFASLKSTLDGIEFSIAEFFEYKVESPRIIRNFVVNHGVHPRIASIEFDLYKFIYSLILYLSPSNSYSEKIEDFFNNLVGFYGFSNHNQFLSEHNRNIVRFQKDLKMSNIPPDESDKNKNNIFHNRISKKPLDDFLDYLSTLPFFYIRKEIKKKIDLNLEENLEKTLEEKVYFKELREFLFEKTFKDIKYLDDLLLANKIKKDTLLRLINIDLLFNGLRVILGLLIYYFVKLKSNNKKIKKSIRLELSIFYFKVKSILENYYFPAFRLLKVYGYHKELNAGLNYLIKYFTYSFKKSFRKNLLKNYYFQEIFLERDSKSLEAQIEYQDDEEENIDILKKIYKDNFQLFKLKDSLHPEDEGKVIKVPQNLLSS
jgi:hypothetical protein